MDSFVREMAFDRSVGILLGHLLGIIFTQHQHSVCFVRGTTHEAIPFTGSAALLPPQVHIVMDGGTHGETVFHQLDEYLPHALEVTYCGSFVVTERALLPFLDRFYDVHEKARARPTAKHLIAITSLEDTMRERLVEHNALEFLVDVLFLVHDGSGTLGLHTTNLLPAQPVGVRIELVQIGEHTVNDLLEGTFIRNPVEYFPDKVTNIHGRGIRVGTLHYPPNAAVKQVPLGEGNAKDANDTTHELLLDGFDLMLTLEFCRHHNCTLEMSIETDWGNPTGNGTATGMLGIITGRQGDIIIGSIYIWDSWFQLASVSTAVSMCSATCLVPKPQLLPFWQTPFLTFPPSLWFLVGVTFVIGTLTVFTIALCRQRFQHPGTDEEPHSQGLHLLDAFFFMVCLYVEQSVRLRNDLLAAVLLLTALLFGGFMIGSSYAGSLASIMTLPRYEKSIDRVADFLDRNMRWTGGSNAWIISLERATRADMIAMRDRFVVYEDAVRERMPFSDRRMGYVFEQTMHGSYGFGTRISVDASKLLQPLKEPIYTQFSSCFYNVMWPLRDAFDAFLLRMHQSGLLHYMELTSVIRTMGLTVQRTISNARLKDNDNSVPVQLSVDHFLGVFFILFTGLGLAGVGFIVEVLVHRLERRSP